MSYLNTDLRIFKFDDGEEHWIVAKNQEEAISCYKECINSEEGYEYEVEELSKDDDTCINCREDDELLAIVNKYKIFNKDDTDEVDNNSYVPIWLYLKYWIIEEELRGNEFEVPNLIGSTAF